MNPAFQSTTSAKIFCALIASLLCLPVLTKLVGHPPREQAYAGMSDATGQVGVHVREIFLEHQETDVLFLGSSLVTAGVDAPAIEKSLSEHLQRPAHIQILGLNWQGMDLQYLLLRDYLETHHPGLIIWNPPFPGSRDIEPHLKAYHWLRFGEYSDALNGLSIRYRLTLYGEMILGAPRELLSHLRPNRIGRSELREKVRLANRGYYESPFIPESIDTFPVPDVSGTQETSPFPLVRIEGRPLNSYELHFARKIAALAAVNHIRLDILHVPTDGEKGKDYIPERCAWATIVSGPYTFIGLPSSVLFHEASDSRFYHFYRDQHLNENGARLFTRSITGAVEAAYDHKDEHD